MERRLLGAVIGLALALAAPAFALVASADIDAQFVDPGAPSIGDFYGVRLPPVVTAAIAVHFGDRTAAGAGAATVSGSSIATGDPLGYFSVSSNSLTLTSAGVGMSACTAGQICETIVTNLGQYINVYKDANTYDVANQTDWNNVTTGTTGSASSLGGKKVEMRPGITITCNINALTTGRNSLRSQDYYSYGGLVVEARDPTNPTTCNDTNGTNVVFAVADTGLTLRGFKFSNPAGYAPQTLMYLDSSGAFPVHDVSFDHDTFNGLQMDPNGDYTGRVRGLQIGTGDGSKTTFTYTAVDNNGHGVPTEIDGTCPAGCGTQGTFVYVNGALQGSDTTNSGVISGAGVVSGTGGGTCGTNTLTNSVVCYDSSGSRVGYLQVTFNTPPASGAPITVDYNVDGATMYLNYDGISGTGSYSNITITNNKFNYLEGAINVNQTGFMTVQGNYDNQFYDRAFEVSYPTPISLASATLSATGVLTTTGSPYLNVGMPLVGAGVPSGEVITGGSGNSWTVSIAPGSTIGPETMTTNIPGKLTFDDNTVALPVGLATDNRNPHTDALQVTATATLVAADWPVEMDRNVLIHGNSRGSALGIHLQGLAGSTTVNSFTGSISGSTLTTTGSPALAVGYILSGVNVPNQTHITAGSGNSWTISTTANIASENMAAAQDSGYFYTGEMIGNVSNYASAFGLGVDQAKNFKAWNNTVIGRNNTSGSGCSTNCDIPGSIVIGDSSNTAANYLTSAGTIDVERNVSESLRYGQTGQTTATANVVMTNVGGSYATTYCQAFAGLGNGSADCASPLSATWNPTTVSDMLIRFAPLPGGPLTPSVTGQTYPTGALGSPAPITFVPQPGSPGANLAH